MGRMESARPDEILRYLAAWRIAGGFLERERAERLRAMTDDECRATIARIFHGPHPPAVDRPCGLVEMQRLFRELR
jgi:hypothetical protein